MKKSAIYIVFLLNLIAVEVTAQSTQFKIIDEENYYQLPIRGEMSLSANYGEIRANHFHAGLDIRVGGIPGMPIVAAADGYISRISVSPTGYGNALYIAHPNGTTSVYGHLQKFTSIINEYAENIQYSRQRFTIDEYLNENMFIVRKGEQIGIAGNSGSSSGAHLHFEIRDTPTQTPLNILTSGYFKPPFDNIPPTFRSIAFFSFDNTDSIPCISLFYKQIKPTRRVMQLIRTTDIFFVGIDVFDSQNNTPAKLGVSQIEVALDNKTVFACHFPAIPFDKSLYVNSVIAYDELIRTKQAFIKTYIEPGNILPIYHSVENNGLISLPDTLVHRLEIKAVDYSGNISVSVFDIQKQNVFSIPPVVSRCGDGVVINRNVENRIDRDGLQVIIPENALYKPIRITADSLSVRPAHALSPAWAIHTPETPLHKAISVKMTAQIPDSLQSKALIAYITDKGNVIFAGGRWQNGSIETTVRSFGIFFVTVDTIAPVIKPLFACGAKLQNNSQLKIKIADDLSGIASFTGYIDGEWALFAYDAKNNTLAYTFDSKRIKRNKMHRLLLSVTDNKYNTSTLETMFQW